MTTPEKIAAEKLKQVQDISSFRFEPSLPKSRPAANDAESSAAATADSAPTPAERWAHANKVAIDLVGGLNAQLWTLAFMLNPGLALISAYAWPKPGTQSSE